MIEARGVTVAVQVLERLKGPSARPAVVAAATTKATAKMIMPGPNRN
jgi:hypothetical protein